MKNKTLGLLGFIAVVLLVAGPAGCRGCGSADRASAPANTVGLNRIQAMAPKRMDFPVQSPWSGTVEGTEAVSLVALESGRIISVDTPDEAFVEKGTLLFTLGGPRILERSKTLQARIISLRKQVNLAGRAATLKEQAMAQKMAKKEELFSVKAALSRLRSALGDAEQEFSALEGRLQVRAPFDGVMTGRRVSPSQDVEKGDLLAELISLNSLRIAAALFPPENSPLLGLQAAVEPGSGKTLPAGRGRPDLPELRVAVRPWDGPASRIGPAARLG